LEASRLPADDPSRQERYAAALSEASEAPLAIARASAEVAELAATIVQKSNPALAGDAIVGVLLAEASTCAAARLVEINLGGDESDRRLPEVQELSRRAGAAREAALGRRWPV
jgi:formiminotetrahydrofolate cyclodeaminase